MHSLALMDLSGDTRIYWDLNDPDSIKAAEEIFGQHKAQGWYGWVPDGNGAGDIIRRFDAQAETIVMSPGIVGG